MWLGKVRYTQTHRNHAILSDPPYQPFSEGWERTYYRQILFDLCKYKQNNQLVPKQKKPQRTEEKHWNSGTERRWRINKPWSVTKRAEYPKCRNLSEESFTGLGSYPHHFNSLSSPTLSFSEHYVRQHTNVTDSWAPFGSSQKQADP